VVVNLGSPHHFRRRPLRRHMFNLALFVAAVAAASCNTFNDPYSVPVTNDLKQPVILALCRSSDCSKTSDRQSLRPSKSGRVNVEAAAGYTPAVVVDEHGHVIGCLPFRFSRRPPGGISVRVSQAVPCDSSRGVESAHDKDWPIPNL
jgi:hypothetical protein